MGIAWALLATTGKIFSLVNVPVVSSFIYKPQVSLFLSILFFSAGVAIGHDTQKIVRSIRHVVLLMARLLLPFITIIGIIFTMVAIFMTSQRQLSGSTIEWITLTIMAIAIIFLNAFYQEGESYKLYPVAIQQTVNVFFLILPVYAIFGLLSFFSSGETFWHFNFFINRNNLNPFILRLFLLFYCVVYAIALFPRYGRLRLIKSFNVVLAISFLIAMLLINNPFTGAHHRNLAGFFLPGPAMPRPDHVKPADLSITRVKQQREADERLKAAGLAWSTKRQHSIVAGVRNGYPLSICRTRYRGGIHPGEFYKGICHFTFAGKTLRAPNFQVLTGDAKKIIWQGDMDYQPKVQVVMGGSEIPPQQNYIRQLRICRVIYHNAIYIGKAFDGECHIPFTNKEVAVLGYQRLAIPKSK
ncbi:DM9 repeat-containing protein [Coxiella burnetii]|uniref:DM9 repeat-containing protein n=1 Tax=Coxiella burnetii TaxID=777 RepID=UPI001ED91967|nr:DM9 repeat-containing protein [Coxiella burnetii]